VDEETAGAAAQLYTVAPSAFLSTRTALARAAKASGDAAAAKEIGALRKPTVAAWAINHLLRRRPELAARLLDVGGRLRSAQTRLDAATLRDLRTTRDALLTELAGAAAEEAAGAGQPLSTAVLTEIRDSVVAALASAEATEAVLSGTLTRALSYSGFGEVDLGDAVARTNAGVRLAVIQGAAPEREATQVLRDRAEGHLRMASQALDATADALAAARLEGGRAQERVRALRAELAQAEAVAEQAESMLGAAVREHDTAVARRDAAAAALGDLDAGTV
jgi:hypothetical protein